MRVSTRDYEMVIGGAWAEAMRDTYGALHTAMSRLVGRSAGRRKAGRHVPLGEPTGTRAPSSGRLTLTCQVGVQGARLAEESIAPPGHQLLGVPVVGVEPGPVVLGDSGEDRPAPQRTQPARRRV